MYMLFYRTLSVYLILALALAPVSGYAEPAAGALPVPETGVFTAGNGSISTSGSTMTITQNADTARGIIDFTSYNVGKDARVEYNQLAGNNSITLNRVNGVSPSEIMGKISANGRIFIVNPNGILFGADSQVDTAGLVASTLNISNADFLAGNYNFSGTGGSIINAGALNAPGGYVALLGGNVINGGSILASLGTIVLASGSALTLGMDPNNIISVVVYGVSDSNPGLADAGVVNTGTIKAQNGTVLIDAETVKTAFNNAVNNSGIVEAGNIEIMGNGDIVLQSGTEITAHSDSGVSSVLMYSVGGDIHVDDSQIASIVDGDGDAAVAFISGAISFTNGSSVSSTVGGSGEASVSAVAWNGNLDVVDSDLLADTQQGSAFVQLVALGYPDEGENSETGFGGDLSIIGSTVKALVHNSPMEEGYSEYGSAMVRLNCESCDGSSTGPTLIDSSDITAKVDANGEAFIYAGYAESGNSVTIRNNSNLLASVGFDSGETAEIEIYGSQILIDASNLDALTTDPDYYGHAVVNLYANITGGDGITIQNGSRVNARTAGYGSAEVNIQSSGYDYETGHYGNVHVANGSTVQATAGSGSALVQVLSDNISVSGSTISSTVRDNVDGGSANLFLYPNSYSYNQAQVINIDNSVLEASTTGRGNAQIDLGRNNGSSYYYYGNGIIDILNNSSLVASVGGGNARVWAWAGDIEVANSSIKALSTAGLDSAYSNASIYLYAYNYSYYYYYNNNSNLLLDNASLVSEVTGIGQAYMYLLSWNYNYYGYYYYYGDSALNVTNGSSLLAKVGHGNANVYLQSQGQINTTDSSIVARSLALELPGESSEDEGYGNSAYIQLYAYRYNNNYETWSQDISLRNSELVAEVLGDGYAQVYLYSYNYNNYYGAANLNVEDSLLRASVLGNGSSNIYLQSYDYYSNDNSRILIKNSQVLSSVGAGVDWARIYMYGDEIELVNADVRAEQAGDGFSEAYLSASRGSILGDAASLITAYWVNLNAVYDIGTFESPINTNTENLSAYSNIYPEWVTDESEESGYYQYGTGNIFVNNIGSQLLNVGYAGTGNNEEDMMESYSSEEDEDFNGVVQANNGVVSIRTQGDMVVHNVIAENGGVLLQSREGSIYAGTSRDGDQGVNVTAGGYSYFSTPKGTIGVGTPDSKDPTISGQIQGIVTPGVTAVTGVNPSPDLDQTDGLPPGPVYFYNLDAEGNLIQSIWPAPGTITSMENPLKVNIQVKPGTPSALPLNFIPLVGGPTGLTLQIGAGSSNNPSSPVAQLINPLLRHVRAYYEILSYYRLVSIDPITPTTFFAYHPLTEADTGAYEGIDLDPNAYEFIDGQLSYNGKDGEKLAQAH